MQFDGGEFGALALDGIEHRPLQHLGFDTPLDQVVLRPGTDRGDAEVLVGQPGQHHDGQRGVALGDAVQRIEAGGIGQVHVQQHTIRPGDGQLPLSICHRLRPHHGDVDAGVGDQLLDQQRIGAIVLDQQQRQQLFRVGR